jgi:uncharacterized protein YdeI (YjbR/CyaY-like superfamily)
MGCRIQERRGAMISDIEDYFSKGCGRCPRFATPDCSTRRWNEGLARLREICLSSGLQETLKWGHPCYMHARRNIAIIGAFREDFRISFFHAALLKDPAGLLERQGPNTRHADMIRLTDNSVLQSTDGIVRAYLAEAMGYAEAGIRPPNEVGEIDLPEELVDALDADPELAEAFHDLTPGRKRSYVINLSSAKTSATRTARIVRFRDRILAGKGATER